MSNTGVASLVIWTLGSMNVYAACEFDQVNATMESSGTIAVDHTLIQCSSVPSSLTVNLANNTTLTNPDKVLTIFFQSGPADILVGPPAAPVHAPGGIASVASGGSFSSTLTFGTAGVYVLQALPNFAFTSPVTINIKVGPTCQVNLSNRVPLLLQGDGSSWAGLTYDNSNTTIGAQGCALTSLSMALNFAGVTTITGVQNTPGTLNTFMEANSLFTGPKGHWVKWDTTVGLLNPALQFDSFQGSVSSTNSPDQAFATLDHFLCSDKPAPVIVGVRSTIHDLTFPFPGHFVLVIGRQINSDGSVSYLIRDPSGTANTLDDFVYTNAAGKPEFETRGAVR